MQKKLRDEELRILEGCDDTITGYHSGKENSRPEDSKPLGIGNRSSTVPSKQLGRNDDGGTLNISVDEISGIETSSSSTITTPRDASSTSAGQSFVTGSSDTTGSLLNDSDDDF
eukprot:g9315.t1 g9315   contig36:319223-319649(+)